MTTEIHTRSGGGPDWLPGDHNYIYDFAHNFPGRILDDSTRDTSSLGYVLHESMKTLGDSDRKPTDFLEQNPGHGRVRGVLGEDVVYERVINEGLPLDVFRTKIAIIRAGRVVCDGLGVKYQAMQYPALLAIPGQEPYKGGHLFEWGVYFALTNDHNIASLSFREILSNYVDAAFSRTPA